MTTYEKNQRVKLAVLPPNGFGKNQQGTVKRIIPFHPYPKAHVAWDNGTESQPDIRRLKPIEEGA